MATARFAKRLLQKPFRLVRTQLTDHPQVSYYAERYSLLALPLSLTGHTDWRRTCLARRCRFAPSLWLLPVGSAGIAAVCGVALAGPQGVGNDLAQLPARCQ